MSDYRILITSSRDWDDPVAVENPLSAHLAECLVFGRRMVVVHGACKTGGDAYADAWVVRHRGQGLPVEVERHPAQGHPTEDFGPWPACGPRRNAHMIGLGAAWCFAFIRKCSKRDCTRPKPHGSHGASGTADAAEAAGIQTWRRLAP